MSQHIDPDIADSVVDEVRCDQKLGHLRFLAFLIAELRLAQIRWGLFTYFYGVLRGPTWILVAERLAFWQICSAVLVAPSAPGCVTDSELHVAGGKEVCVACSARFRLSSWI